MKSVITFFKVIILDIGLFESEIIDERHFESRIEANNYANAHIDEGLPIIIEMVWFLEITNVYQ